MEITVSNLSAPILVSVDELRIYETSLAFPIITQTCVANFLIWNTAMCEFELYSLWCDACVASAYYYVLASMDGDVWITHKNRMGELVLEMIFTEGIPQEGIC